MIKKILEKIRDLKDWIDFCINPIHPTVYSSEYASHNVKRNLKVE